MLHAAAPPVGLIWIGSLAIVLSLDSLARRRRRELPRVLWGPTPIINIKYWSQAVRSCGFKSSTLVYTVYPAFKRADFDRHLDEFGPHSPPFRFLAPYFAFAWGLRNADVFVFAYDGGLLALTPLKGWECQLMKLAGKRIVMIPYGGDISVPGTMGPVEAGVYEAYPDLLRRADEIRRRVLYFARHADFVIRSYQPGFQPRQDLLWPNCLSIDAEAWKPAADDAARGGDAREAEVVVVHPTNHRSVKGTAYLVAAVDELRNEGLRLRLDVIEGRPNAEVKEAMTKADVVGEQFIAGYGLTAVEAMALGRPVLSNLTWLAPEFWDGTSLRECPIVSTRPESLKADLRSLAIDPARRARLGAKGRQYVLKYHSAEAVGRIWTAILRHVWLYEPIAPKVSADFAARPDPA